MLTEINKFTYKLMVSIFSVVDFLREMVGILSGIGKSDDEMLLTLIKSEEIKSVFLVVLLIGFMLLTLFTILAILKSEAVDLDKNGKGAILKNTVKSFISFLIIPFGLVAFIMLTNVIMGAVNSGASGIMSGGSETFGGELFITSVSDAYIYDIDSRNGIERAIVIGELPYKDYELMSSYYDINEINYFIGIVGGITILVMMVIAAIAFIQRIFDTLLLFIVSPLAVSTMPLDSGSRFSTWRELVIGKVVGAYGIVISLNLFFLIIPYITSRIYFESSAKSGLLKLLVLIGGTFSVTKASLIISTLVGSKASRNEVAEIISNMKTAKAIVIGTAGTIASGTTTAIGGVIGGRTFLLNRKKAGVISSIEKISKTEGTSIFSGKPGRLRPEKNVVSSLISGGIVKVTKDIKKTKEQIKGK